MPIDEKLVKDAEKFYGTPHNHAVREALFLYGVYAELAENEPAKYERRARDCWARLACFVETGEVGYLTNAQIRRTSLA